MKSSRIYDQSTREQINNSSFLHKKMKTEFYLSQLIINVIENKHDFQKSKFNIYISCEKRKKPLHSKLDINYVIYS